MQMSQGIGCLFTATKWLEVNRNYCFISKPGEGNMNCVLRIGRRALLLLNSLEAMWRNTSSSGSCRSRT
jgi:hypothetical protein